MLPADQKLFIEENLHRFVQHSADGTAKTQFWPAFLVEWFKRWPLPAPSFDAIAKEGTFEKAKKVERTKQIKRVKRTMNTAADDNATGGRRKLHLEDPPPRKRSEVQVYMSLFYDTRIQAVVQEQWAKEDIENVNFNGSDIPEDQVDPEDSSLLKDTKIPLCYKNAVARKLYNKEEEEIKEVVRSTRDAEHLIKTVYNTDGNERRELVEEYKKNIASLRRSMVYILRNVEQKCAAKGIFWLACPTASVGGRPVGQFHCIGQTVDGKDFEAHMGAEKAEEFKTLFSSWMHQVYPEADWAMFTTDEPAEPTDEPVEPTDEPVEPTDATAATDGVTDNLTALPTAPEVPPTQPASSTTASAVPSDGSPAPSNQPPAPSNQPPAPSNQPPVPSNQPLAPSKQSPTPSKQSLTPSKQSPTLSKRSSAPSKRSSAPSNRSPTTPEQPKASNTMGQHPGGAIPDSNPPCSPATNALSMPPPSATQTPARLQEDRAPHNASQANAIPPPQLLAGATCGSSWMNKKKTIKYLRETFKLGRLSEVITHWYELEGLLGFQEVTPAGFPITKRPEVVRTFFKNRHSYQRNYDLDACVLGQEIMEWWSEICSSSPLRGVQFGGPTGIYTVIILVSWWCSLLEKKSTEERADCVRTLEDIDRALLMAIGDIKNHTNPTSQPVSPSPPPSSQPRKRANSEEMSSRQKRLRSG